MASRDLGSALQGAAQAFASIKEIELVEAIRKARERAQQEALLEREQVRQTGMGERADMAAQLRILLQQAREEAATHRERLKGRQRIRGERVKGRQRKEVEAMKIRGREKIEGRKAGARAAEREDVQAHQRELEGMRQAGRERLAGKKGIGASGINRIAKAGDEAANATLQELIAGELLSERQAEGAGRGPFGLFGDAEITFDDIAIELTREENKAGTPAAAAKWLTDRNPKRKEWEQTLARARTEREEREKQRLNRLGGGSGASEEMALEDDSAPIPADLLQEIERSKDPEAMLQVIEGMRPNWDEARRLIREARAVGGR